MPGYKAAKDRLTLLFGDNASGDMKLKPLLVYLSENPRALKNIAKGSLPVVWKSNPKAWVTQAIFQDWFFHHFIPEVQKYCLEKDIPFNSFAAWQCSGPPPIHGRLSSQCQSSACATEYSVAPTYGPGSYSDFQEILFTSHFLSGSKGKWWIRNNLATILEGL